MTDGVLSSRAEVAIDFQRLRRRAAVGDLVRRLTGGQSDLLSYDDVRQKLRAKETAVRRLEDVPLDAIVGSAGRYREFRRGFLPGGQISGARWAGVKLAMTGMTGVPPIEVYRIGEAYFVQDGNHRVSVAREMGSPTIEAWVTEVHSDVTVGPDIDEVGLIVLSEQADFLARTNANRLLPGVRLRLTEPGQYPRLAEHIDVHRYYMGEEGGVEVPYDRALRHWHVTLYAPAVEVIRRNGLLRDFAGRTETDLYLWLSRHRDELIDSAGWDLSLDAAAGALRTTKRVAPASEPPAARARLDALLAGSGGGAAAVPRDGLAAESIADKPTLRAVEPQPAALAAVERSSGESVPAVEPTGSVLRDIVVLLPGGRADERALDMATAIATREGARMHGLGVETVAGGDRVAETHLFDARCREAGVSGRLAFAAGDHVEATVQRARLADLVVAPYVPVRSHPGATRSLSPAFRSLMRRCPRPVLAVPPLPADRRERGGVERLMLAFDGSDKATEALMISAYLTLCWELELVVVTVSEVPRRHDAQQQRVREVLEPRGATAVFARATGRVASAVLDTARNLDADMIVMGGHGRLAALEIVLGGTTREVLRYSSLPVLVCQ